MRSTTLTEKLVIASFIISIVIILVVSSFTFNRAKTAILDRTFQQLTSVKVVKGNMLKRFFSNAIDEISLVKESKDVFNIVNEINALDTAFILESDYEISGSASFINQLKKKIYDNVYIIGNRGIALNLNKSSFHKFGEIPIFEEIKKQQAKNDSVLIFQSGFRIDKPEEKYLYLSARINDSEGLILGDIVFEISYTHIDKIMLEVSSINGFGISGESYLVGSDFLMRSTSRFTPNSILKTQVKTFAVEQALKGKNGTAIINDYRGIKVLSSYGRVFIPGLKWVIVVEIDFNEATVPIVKIRNQIIFISIFIFLIVLLVTIVFSRRITYPIQRLNKAANQIGEGDFEIDIETNLNDEIGDLTRTFNNMSRKLKQSSLELKTEKMRSLGALIDGQENERNRISRELHDSLGQLLIGLKMKYESCLNAPENKFLIDKKSIEMGTLFDRTIEETRRISNNLAPVALSEFGLRTALRNMCSEISETSNLQLELINEVNDNLLPGKMQVYIFRIIQEALTNIIKHADAKNVGISLKSNQSHIVILVEDDGLGFDLPKVRKEKNSNGLNNINNRVTVLNGKLIIKTALSKGTKLKILLPKK
jgi:signal transduction histidine kinase